MPRSAVQARVDAVVWPHGRHAGRARRASPHCPAGLSPPGPLRLIVAALVVAAWCSILGGAAYGPVAERLARRAAPDAAGAGRCRLSDGRTRAGCARWPGWCCWTRDDRILLLHGLRAGRPGRRLVVHARRRPGGRRDPGGGRPAGARGGDRDHRRRARARCCGSGPAPSPSTGGAGTRTSGTTWPVRPQTRHRRRGGLTELERRSVAGAAVVDVPRNFRGA